MKHHLSLSTYSAWLGLAVLACASCADGQLQPAGTDGLQTAAVALRGIRADIVQSSDGTPLTRANDNQPLPLVDSIGRYTFATGDEIHFTQVQRTTLPISPFIYDNVVYRGSEASASSPSTGSTADANLNSVSWTRETPVEDIYWSDGHSDHTFAGYLLPHEDGKTAAESVYGTAEKRQTGFDWQKDADSGIFYGSIGNPYDDVEVIDYTETPAQDKSDVVYSTEKLRKEDLLLTYDNALKNEDAIAWIRFHHALSSIRVMVTITGFSNSASDPDAKTMVSNMTLLNQPTMYKWRGSSYNAEPVAETDQTVITALYTAENLTADDIPQWNQTKTMKLWQPRVQHGTGSGKTFSFYGITAPGPQQRVSMSFNVTYPDPLNPTAAPLQKTYTAVLELKDADGQPVPVQFWPGHCTCITVNLNHRDEVMTVGAEYMSWQYVETPDESHLRKKSTFLSDASPSAVTIHTDSKATVDDATWLYRDGDNIRDIYGNDGTVQKPYLITSADELLSFAKEVNSGYDFTGKNVKLDANLYLQGTTTTSNVTWPGIGTNEHPFNGNFAGGTRSIKRLKGAPLFVNIGPLGHVGNLWLEDVLEVTSGGGAFAALNQGVICACTVSSLTSQATTDASGNSITVSGKFAVAPVALPSGLPDDVSGKLVAGAMVGHNQGIIMTCHSQGNFEARMPGENGEGADRVGGLVGFNEGAIVVSYAATRSTTPKAGALYRGIVAYNHYAPNPLPEGRQANEYGTLTYCFFDKTLAKNVLDENTLAEVEGRTTVQMQAHDFIGTKGQVDAEGKKTLNGSIHSYTIYTEHYPKCIQDAIKAQDPDKFQTLLDNLKAHLASHYYEHQVSSYPKVY